MIRRYRVLFVLDKLLVEITNPYAHDAGPESRYALQFFNMLHQLERSGGQWADILNMEIIINE